MDEFIIEEFNGAQIRIRKKDKYLSATDMCQVSGKKLPSDYLRLENTKLFIKYLEQEVKVEVVDKHNGNHKYRGTWIHPRLATNLAQWVSIKFSIKVSQWVENWRSLSVDNDKDYLLELANLEADKECDQKEREICSLLLAQNEGAEVEVETAVGFVDVLTSEEIIEVKIGANWKHALGQILAYSEFYQDRKKVVYLFDADDIDFNMVKTIMAKYDVELRVWP